MISPEQLRAKNKRLLWVGGAVVVFMFGFAFALIPFYQVVCKITGLNGKTSGRTTTTAVASAVDTSRTVNVIFLATNNENLPWDFKPTVTEIAMHPGEDKRIAYYAKNNSGQRMTVQAVPSVTPGIAAKYIQKTECFCFENQTFDNAESQDMPLILRLDQSLPKNINTIVLSYTLFDVGGLGVKPSSNPAFSHKKAAISPPVKKNTVT